MQRVYKATKDTLTAPLSFIKKKCNNENDPTNGTYITDRKSIDQHIIEWWQHIRDGNIKDGEKHNWVHNFYQKYARHIFHAAEEYQLGDVDPHKLQQECLKANHSAPSLDGWHSAEFSLLPLPAFVVLAEFLNRVETEGKWPDSQAIAKAVFLHKDDPSEAGPLDLRPLLILPTLYRRWASMRLGELHSWIETWQLDEIFAGVPGQSAEELWANLEYFLKEVRLAHKHSLVCLRNHLSPP